MTGESVAGRSSIGGGLKLQIKCISSWILRTVLVSALVLTPLEPPSLPAQDRSPDHLDAAAVKQQRWQGLLKQLRQEEARFDSYSAKMTITQNDRTSHPPTKQHTTSIQQTVRGDRFWFVTEESNYQSGGDPYRERVETIFDGTQTLVFTKNIGLTVYSDRVESQRMTPPHIWGIFDWNVFVPLSIYLAGGDELINHKKVWRFPIVRAPSHQLLDVKSEIVGEERIDDLDCFVVLTRRRSRLFDEPLHQYFWLSKERNLHVVQSRTAMASEGEENPQNQSRVKSWRRLADDLWVPELVEVTLISADSVANKRADAVVAQLMLESISDHPADASGEFSITDIPSGLPRFKVDATHHLVDSPLHPVPVNSESSIDLETILERLGKEEKNFNTVEMVVESNFELLNPHEPMSWQLVERKSRTVVDGPRMFLQTDFTIRNQNSGHSHQQRFLDDGNVQRTTESFFTAKPERNIATIDPGRHEHLPTNCHEQLIRIPRDLQSILKRQTRKMEQAPDNVEYLGDERIGDLVCHKLKCSFRQNFDYLWLARDRNLLPVRQEIYSSRWHPTLPVELQYVEELTEVRPELWFPRKIKELSFRTLCADGMGLNRIAIRSRRDATVTTINLMPHLTDQLFTDVEIPAGTTVSVMDSNSRVVVQFDQQTNGRLDVVPQQPLLANAAAQTASKEKKPQKKNEFIPSRRRGDSPTAQLLDQLEELNQNPTVHGEQCFGILRQIIELNGDVVPALIEELDATSDQRMLTSLSLVLRVLNDRRAVPSLIRAIPRTLQPPNTDFQVRVGERELVGFFKRHEVNRNGEADSVILGKPVTEVCGALNRLTGREFGEKAIYQIGLAGLPTDQRLQRLAYDKVARDWSTWWEQHWGEFSVSESFANVDLPAFELYPGLRSGIRLKRLYVKQGLLLESVLNPNAKQVFYDIDADQFAALPEKWSKSDDIQGQMPEILVWAQEKGFDLMGIEYEPPQGGPRTFALRGIGLQTSQIDDQRWEGKWSDFLWEDLRHEGFPVVGSLLHRDAGRPSQVVDPGATATFMAVTSERLPVVLHVGVQVQTDRRQPGHFY